MVERLLSLLIVWLCAFVPYQTQAGVSQHLESIKPSIEKPTIRIGTTNNSLSEKERRAIAQTFIYLSEKLPQYKIELRDYPVAHLETAVKQGELDIFLATSGFYRRVYHRGLRDLVTLTTPAAPNPNFGSGSIFVVPKDSPIKTVSDMKGKTAVVSWPEGFTGYFIPLSELHSQGYDPDNFFKSFVQGGSPMPRLLESLLDNKGDVALARACTWEELQNQKPEFVNQFRIIGLKSSVGTQFRCLHSTDLFPNWTIVSTSQAPWQVTRDVTSVLLNMPRTSEGFAWGVVSDFVSVDELYRNLKRGPYEYLRIHTLRDFVRHYWPYMGIFVVLVLGLALHSWRCRLLIQKKTQELSASMVKERAAIESAREAERQKELLEKVSVIGAMSSLITHELNAPLNAIVTNVRFLERFFEDRPVPQTVNQALILILRQCARASEIVQHVRAYVKRREIVQEPVDVTKTALTVVRDMSMKHPAITFKKNITQDSCWIAADQLEIDLLITNLVKNSVEALRNAINPIIEVCVYNKEERIYISVADNASTSTIETLKHFEISNIDSKKQNGLGLGLLIVRTIVERCSGNMQAHWCNPGVQVIVSIPVLQPKAIGENK